MAKGSSATYSRTGPQSTPKSKKERRALSRVHTSSLKLDAVQAEFSHFHRGVLGSLASLALRYSSAASNPYRFDKINSVIASGSCSFTLSIDFSSTVT